MGAGRAAVAVHAPVGGGSAFYGKLVFFRGLPLGQPPSLPFRRAAAAFALLDDRPACAANTPPMSPPQCGHFNLLML